MFIYCLIKVYYSKLIILLGDEKCMLDILLSLKDEESNTGFTNKELQDHVMTFMSAGYEVNATTYSR